MDNYTEFETLSNSMLNRWWANRKNVLIYGDHGCGKTTIIKEFWDKIGIKYAIFSGATLDPWTDLIGIPKLTKGKGGESQITFALPQNIDENVEAIFIDEFNRSHAKVRNALLELMQFKTINGRKFPKLKVVWAAANPIDTERNYDVEVIDPAQEDRFHIIVKLSNKPNRDYFISKYGAQAANGAIAWRDNLMPELQASVSPRRLDYALDYIINCGGNAREVFPNNNINCLALMKAVNQNGAGIDLQKLINQNDSEGIKKFFNSEKLEEALPVILESYSLSKNLVLNADIERVFSIASSEPNIALLTCDLCPLRPDLTNAIKNIPFIKGEQPQWVSNGQAYSVKLRTFHSLIEKECNKLTDQTNVCISEVGELDRMLKSHDLSEILDEVDGTDEPYLWDMSIKTAINLTKLFYYARLKNSTPNGLENKYKSLLWSAIYKLYLHTGNLSFAAFHIRGFEILLHDIPRGRQKKALTTTPAAFAPVRKNNGAFTEIDL